MAVATLERRLGVPAAEGAGEKRRAVAGVAPEPAAVQLKSVEDLSDKSWRVLRATPLYRLSTDPASLLAYSRALEAKMRAWSMQGHAVVVGDAEQGELSVEIGVVANVASTARDADALGILIRRQQGSAGADDEEDNEEFLGYPIDGSGLMVGMSKKQSKAATRAVVFQGVLCSVGDDRPERAPRAFTSLPVFLAKGKTTISKQVIAYLEWQFDCRILPMPFPPAELAWMAALWGGAHMEMEVRWWRAQAARVQGAAGSRSASSPQRDRYDRGGEAPPRPPPASLELVFDVPPAVTGLSYVQARRRARLRRSCRLRHMGQTMRAPRSRA